MLRGVPAAVVWTHIGKLFATLQNSTFMNSIYRMNPVAAPTSCVYRIEFAMNLKLLASWKVGREHWQGLGGNHPAL